MKEPYYVLLGNWHVVLTFSAAHYWAKAFPTLPLTPKTHPPPQPNCRADTNFWGRREIPHRKFIMGRAGWLAGRVVWSTEMAIWDWERSQLCTHICKATEKLAHTVGASEGFVPSDFPSQDCVFLEQHALLAPRLLLPNQLRDLQAWSISSHQQWSQGSLCPSLLLPGLQPEWLIPCKESAVTPA